MYYNIIIYIKIQFCMKHRSFSMHSWYYIFTSFHRDAERKERVQEIFSLLQTQQAEAKREKKQKK